jgi:hypothetical protein
MVSFCSLVIALLLSSYRRGMLVSNIPRSEYTMSSSLVVSLFAVCDILFVML